MIHRREYLGVLGAGIALPGVVRGSSGEITPTSGEAPVTWTFEPTGDRGQMTNPGIGTDHVYVGVLEGVVYSLDSDTGQEIWSYPTSHEGVTRISVSGDTVYATASSWDEYGILYSLDAETGSLKWRFTESNNPLFWRFSEYHGTIILPTEGTLYGLDAATGDVQWEVGLPYNDPMNYSVSDGIICIVSREHPVGSAITAITVDGTELWEYEDIESGDPIVTDELAFFSTSDDTLHAVDLHDGTGVWELDEQNVAGPHAIRDGTLYVSTGDRARLYAVDAATGTRTWSFIDLDDPVQTLTMGPDHLYVITELGSLFAIDYSGELAWISTEISGDDFIAAEEFAAGMVAVTVIHDFSEPSSSVYSFDAQSGEHRWRHEVDELLLTAIDDDTLYGAGEALYAIATSGDPAFEIDHVDIRSSELEPGGELEVTVTVSNTGGAPDIPAPSMTLQNDSLGQPTDPLWPELAPGDHASSTLTGYMPEDPGSYTVVIETDDDQWTEPVTVKQPAQFEVVEIGDRAIEIHQGDQFDLIVAVANHGEIADSQPVRLYLDGEEIRAQAVSLDPDDAHTLSFEDVEPTLEPGDYDFEIVTDDDADGGTVTVLAPARFDLDVETSEQTVAPGDAVTVQVDVTNNGHVTGTADVALVRDGDIVESTSRQLAGGERETVTFDLVAPSTPGEYTYDITAADASEPVTLVVSDDPSDDGVGDGARDDEQDDRRRRRDRADDSDDSLPGPGILGTLATLGGVGYVIHRRRDAGDED